MEKWKFMPNFIKINDSEFDMFFCKIEIMGLWYLKYDTNNLDYKYSNNILKNIKTCLADECTIRKPLRCRSREDVLKVLGFNAYLSLKKYLI